MPAEPRHRYAMEELLDEIPAPWRRDGSRLIRKEPHVEVLRSSIGWRIVYSARVVILLEAPYTKPFPTPYTAMAAIDEWIEANP